MAISISVSGTQLYISGLTSGHNYAFRIYYKTPDSSTWDSDRRPATGTLPVYSTTYGYNFNSLLSESGIYRFYVNVWDATTSTNTETSTVTYSYGDEVSIRAECGTGVQSYTISCDGTSKLVRASVGYTFMTVASGRTVIISKVTPVTNYGSPYSLHYNTKNDPNGWYGPITFTASTMVENTSYDRHLRVTAAMNEVYPYTQKVYIDCEFYSSTENIYNTESTIAIGDLSLYTKYSANYDFDYATVGSSTIKRNQYYNAPLNLNSNTDICLYFTSPPAPVKPTITRITATQNTATVYWDANGGAGGNDGYWVLYYGVSTSSMSSIRLTDDSVAATITGLQADTTYVFYIRHYVSGDYLQSSSMSATTKSAISYFAWTSNDSLKIQAGQPVTNLTASAWNNLINKVSACGGSTGSIPRATAGSQITAEHFNQMRNAIAGLSGSGSVASSVSAGSTKMRATLFANATTALKEAINRAISTKNG